MTAFISGVAAQIGEAGGGISSNTRSRLMLKGAKPVGILRGRVHWAIPGM